jgi:peptidoglycan/LPS O-acetylase OafA/YrhL
MLCCSLLFAGVGTPARVLLYMLCLPYLVIYVATKTPLVPIRKIGDLSYGLYLFAFPIQQALQETFPHIGPRTLTIAATVMGLAVAYASYWTVESRFLKLRKKRRPDVHSGAARGEGIRDEAIRRVQSNAQVAVRSPAANRNLSGLGIGGGGPYP